MNAELIQKYVKALEKLKDREYLKAVVNYNISPVVEGSKPATIITLNTYGRNLKDLWLRYSEELWNNKELKWLKLRENQRSIILFIYSEGILKDHLNRQDVKDYLQSCGYDYTDDIVSLLEVLKERYREGCPHEIGIFLGIPVRDVDAFVKGGKKPLISKGYWKVYYDAEEAIKLFSLYDHIRERAVQDIIKILD